MGRIRRPLAGGVYAPMVDVHSRRVEELLLNRKLSCSHTVFTDIIQHSLKRYNKSHRPYAVNWQDIRPMTIPAVLPGSHVTHDVKIAVPYDVRDRIGAHVAITYPTRADTMQFHCEAYSLSRDRYGDWTPNGWSYIDATGSFCDPDPHKVVDLMWHLGLEAIMPHLRVDFPPRDDPDLLCEAPDGWDDQSLHNVQAIFPEDFPHSEPLIISRALLRRHGIAIAPGTALPAGYSGDVVQWVSALTPADCRVPLPLHWSASQIVELFELLDWLGIRMLSQHVDDDPDTDYRDALADE